ncbi:MAG: nitroreductase family protein [Planctomycetes bacterium]|nr:nitroreductase family protein [Planctomycetota bacterium]MCB9910794.1 nitroreductase family protein [Planctomycetota bacterium]MCB9912821.1 nitroreductase family protein [Planctomycetota bacterium]HPF13996.1 nitroreductase family protein [Planctomycetota bacterium]HRV80209.1 nitroreductase family protein [Planctomycetota bacterium]
MSSAADNEAEPFRGGSGPDDGSWHPLDPLPQAGFWDVLYRRRSIRKFESEPVPRQLIDQVLHAGIWAPSSCNYQMWDLVAVDDPALNAALAALSAQMGNAPVNIVVAYGRDFSEENFANIQSASALIQNMSLAAEALGLGTFWITQTGDGDQVRQMVGLPHDRMVVAVLALGYPKIRPKRGPKRRPLEQVTHYNHYSGKPIPSSIDPEVWDPELLAIYQRARVLNGLRHNKPRPWERRALEAALDALVPAESTAPEGSKPRWLDVLPCTGILTEALSQKRRGYAFDVVERTAEVATWCAERAFPKGQGFAWPHPSANFRAPEPGTYDVVSCLFRLEGLRAADRIELWKAMHAWLKPGGLLFLGFVSDRSFHHWTERMRARRAGPKGVEYVLAPDPNVGPFRALAPGQVEREAQAAGLQSTGHLGLQATPEPDEVEFRTRNFRGAKGKILRSGARFAGMAFSRAAKSRGRFQFRLYRKP